MFHVIVPFMFHPINIPKYLKILLIYRILIPLFRSSATPLVYKQQGKFFLHLCQDIFNNIDSTNLTILLFALFLLRLFNQVLSSKPTNHQPLVQAVQPQVKPRLISDMVKPKLISEPSPNKLKLIQESTAVKPKLNTESPKLAHENKLGVVLKQSSTKVLLYFLSKKQIFLKV